MATTSKTSPISVLDPNMCRLCLLYDPDVSTVSVFSIANGFVVADMILACLSIELGKDDPYGNVCSSCIVTLVSMYEMYLKYREKNELFLEMQQQVTIKPADSLDSLIEECYETSEDDLIEEEVFSSDDNSPSETQTVPSPNSPGDVALKTAKEIEPSTSFDDSVYYLEELGPYVRPEELDNLGQGSIEQQVDDEKWNQNETTVSLMEELNAQVAKLDSQELTEVTDNARQEGVSEDESTKARDDLQVEIHNILPSFLEEADTPEACATVSIYTPDTTKRRKRRYQTFAFEQKYLASNVPEEEIAFEEIKYRCNICCTTFENDAALVNHFPAHFYDLPKDCDFCGTHYQTVMSLNRHLAYHNTERPYKCDKCKRCFADKFSYSWHSAEFHMLHTGPTVAAEHHKSMVCDICGKIYILAEPFEHHIRQHEGRNSYRCKLCDRTFPRNMHLMFHLETHARARLHRCQRCPITFASLFMKNLHEKRHGHSYNERGHRCPLCLSLCRTQLRLVAHVESNHPGDPRIQLLQCSFNDCRLKFLDLEQFQTHITAHRVCDLYPCSHCARVFKQQRFLDTHLEMVHNVKVQRDTENGTLRHCLQCRKVFRTEKGLIAHVRYIHGSATMEESLPQDT